MKPQIVINDVLGQDEYNFALNAWLKIGINSRTYQGIKHSVYYVEMTNRIKDIMKDNETKILIARNAELEDQLFGFIIYRKSVLHMCYVKGLYRDLGLFKEMIAMIPTLPTIYTVENSYSKILKKYNMEYNPFESTINS